MVLVLSCVLAIGCSGNEPQAEYPSHKIDVIVPFPAGGTTDTLAHVLKDASKKNGLLDVPLVVVNVPGGSGTIGSRRVRGAKPDGYTVLLLHDAIVTAKYSGKVEYGPEAFEPVAAFANMGLVVVVQDTSYQSLTDLLTAASAKPGAVSFGVSLGTPSHFSALLLEANAAGVEFRYVDSGGGADRFRDLRGGHIDATVFSIEEYLRYRHKKSDQEQDAGLRGLAYLQPERHPAAPELPTAREQDVDVDFSVQHYVWVPKGTPPERKEMLANLIESAVATDVARKKMEHCDSDVLRGAALQQHVARVEREIASVEPKLMPLPNYVAYVLSALGILGLIVGVQLVRENRVAEPGSKTLDRVPVAMAVGCTIAVVIYVALWQWAHVDYRVATGIFVLACGLMLTRFARHSWPWVLVEAVVLAFGIHFVFWFIGINLGV